MKYSPPARPKLAPKLKVLGIYWNLTHFIFRISRAGFWFQKLFSLNTYHLFGTRIYWNLAHSIFQICQSRCLCQKWFLLNIYHILDPNRPQIKSAKNLLKFGTFDISNMLISILMQKNFFYRIFANCLAQIGPKNENVQSCSKWNIKFIIFFFLEYHISYHCSQLYSIIRILNH